ncbi:glucose-6-phosphate dehydrogenase assembly protein OpcA [Leucobacter sp. CSA1]|uniref:Glucose-6-phosphate dehydrogenase assembly protein OpcA n=1 Tax=Leucobacter chromiisoli TaxID=2796471 RepID=A0A934UTR1_9MICO|nr:glucose-6-phosphate dehydrogenase assembly protein OpcA [Leucobacter chromiisoli]MBK0417995.1 glucose-6-phosphate dehydrogenase assembly protein OpcA [Leucobacter chromiisoli]
MIEQLPDTTVQGISKRMVSLRAEGGATTLGRVLTLIVVTTTAGAEEAISAANFASREHPMRIIVLAMPDEAVQRVYAAEETSVADGLDAEIRVGRDAGAGEVIVLRPRGGVAAEPDRLVSGLLLADAPVVAWWSGLWPRRADGSPIGRLAQRRITDSGGFDDPAGHLGDLSAAYTPGDTDLAWSRLTLWRAQLAAALDNASGREITGVTVNGTPDSSSTMLLAAWLRLQLGVPVTQIDLPRDTSVAWGIHSVALHSAEGDTAIERSHGAFAAITQPGHPRLEVPLPRRSLPDCLVEDLRLLNPDELYGRVITEGVPLLLAEREAQR